MKRIYVFVMQTYIDQKRFQAEMFWTEKPVMHKKSQKIKKYTKNKTWIDHSFNAD